MNGPLVSRWLDWKPETPNQATDKTDKSSERGQPPPDLTHSVLEVRQRLPGLTPGHRTYFDYWVDLYISGGYGQEDAERGAFAKTLGRGPLRLKELGIWRD